MDHTRPRDRVQSYPTVSADFQDIILGKMKLPNITFEDVLRVNNDTTVESKRSQSGH
jgi:hypothetical protein